MKLPKPHYDKIISALKNTKLPVQEKPRLEETLNQYNNWINKMEKVNGNRNEIVSNLVSLFNEYKLYVDFELIFSSEQDFLYRQKGQLKLDNTIIEEFLPHLISKAFPELDSSLNLGPTNCFSAAFFQSSLKNSEKVGLSIRTKDQDFAISRKVYLKSSFSKDFNIEETVETYIGYIMSECKTNLDKTMFQEATATAHDVKSAVPGSKYFLLCEWLDMTPTSTAPTDIDEVLILRKAKRINSNIRSKFDTYDGRMRFKDFYINFLKDNPFNPDVFSRLIGHIERVLSKIDPIESNVLEDGFF